MDRGHVGVQCQGWQDESWLDGALNSTETKHFFCKNLYETVKVWGDLGGYGDPRDTPTHLRLDFPRG